MRLSARNQSSVDGTELGYKPLTVSFTKKQSPCEVHHMEAFHGAARQLSVSKKIGMCFMLALQNVTQKRHREHEPFIIFR
jgi:hypothetical protein